MGRRVVVTGLGAVTPIGLTVDEFWKSALAGTSGIARITRFDPGRFSSQIAGEVKDFDPTPQIGKKEVRRMDRFVQFAHVATMEAVEQAGLDMLNIDTSRVAVIIGSGIGGVETWEQQHTKLIDHGPERISPFFIPMMIADMAAGKMAMVLGAHGPNYATVSACASGAHAIGQAYRSIQYGECDVAIAGGAEAPITPLSVGGFCVMRALSTRNEEPERASRPFDRDRDGFVIAEGAGIVVLEELSRAKARSAPVLAEVAGYGLSADAHHVTAPAPDGQGAALAMKMALRNGIDVVEVDYINAHGTSTELNDKYETIAIKKVFGEHARKIAVNATKSMTGHLLGAGGAIEFIATVMSIRDSMIHPTVNLENPDPECDLDYVPGEARQRDVNCAMSNSFGFGGHNVSLLVKKYRD
ncbi:3-oxoacyl-ACP synthase [candidate division TA06 bacterium DG_24]|uniref:3-oxoacyl-[acyl-carrier-protein] synthase 2 n=2 Tax=Bacteria division TA06 TaxID=1156500 RepID=A0A0S8JPQ3_UNCT6|nr:MAG: 3-oxoacyl-ACP synthase [candidate division TA06 bacterium DG_24]KPL11488.1 MAG: 3-oxoacyl-ACP synthase [candidate division TA06 bacterium SM1_40]